MSDAPEAPPREPATGQGAVEPGSERRRPRLSLASRVLIGLFLGLLAGIFLGEESAFLEPVGRAFVRLLQMSVLPFVAVSLVAGMGSLDAALARQIAIRGGIALLVLWGVTLFFVALFGVALPSYTTASFFSSALVEQPAEMDLLSLYIPSNPFHSLVNAVMPSVVLFSLAVGVALIAMPDRAILVEQLQVLADALLKVNEWAVALAPYGVFALMAQAAGSVTIDEIQRLQLFMLVYCGAALILSLWVIPGLVAALTPLDYRQVISPARDALVTGFATGSLLIVLPILARHAAEMVETAREAHGAAGEDDTGSDVTRVLVPVAFNFPSGGKLLNLGFIIFAGWFTGARLAFFDYPVLLGVGTATFFGPSAMAVPYMLDLFRLPSDLFQVFLAMDVVTARFGVTVAVMHVLALAVLTGVALEGRLRFKPMAFARWAGLSVALTVGFFLGARVFFSQVINLDSHTYELFVQMELHDDAPARIVTQAEAPRPTREGALREIRDTGLLRVCYAPNSLPYAFINENNHLVGFDIEVAHALAKQLGVSLYFERSETRDELLADLATGRCHIAMSGIALTPERAEAMSFTQPYLDNTLAFIVDDVSRHDWATWPQILAKKEPVVAVPDTVHYVHLLEQKIPNAKLQPVKNVRPYFRGEMEGVDALAYGAEGGGAWTLVYPGFAVVVPQPNPVRVPLAYGVRRGEWEWIEYLDIWLELKKQDHTLSEVYEHWILGQHAEGSGKRWSVIRDVLHWVD